MESLLVGVAALGGATLLVSKTGASVFQAAELGVGVFLFGSLTVKIIRASIYPFYFSELRHLPGPKDDQFLVGQGLRLISAAGPNELYLEWVRKWPDAPFIRHLNWGNSEVLLVNNLEACRDVLQTNSYSFVRPAFFVKLLGDVLGVGLLFSVGEQHKRLRRVMAEPVSRPSVRKLLPVFKEKARDLSAQFDDAIEGETKGVVEVESLFSRTALSVIGVSLLGKDIHSFRSKTSSLSFEECYRAILNPPLLGKLIMFINPFIPLRWLPIDANLDFIRGNTALRAMISELIRERTAEIQATKNSGSADEASEGRDLLTKMIEANLSESHSVSEQELIDTFVQSVSAGHETTAGALTWTTYALVKDPIIQSRLRAEILAAQRNQPELDAASIDNLQYLNNIVRESLRMYSPTLMAPWETAEDLVIAGVRVPKGTTVTTIPAMLHHNPSIWGDDVGAFNPDRWDDISGSAASPYAIEAFLNGPRMCPGKALALLEIKAVLVELVSNFELEAVDTELRFEHPALTLKPKGGLRIRVRRLQ